MLADLRTVLWKEFREFAGQRSTLLSIAIFLGMFAVFMPYQRGREWLESPLGVANLVFVPLFLVLTLIADAFAGERERHTLDTLLASRLPDQAILFGKAIAAVGYGWVLTLLGLLVGLATVNVKEGADDLLLYPAGIGFGAAGFSLLAIAMVTGAGILFSLRASTVRQAQQTLNAGLLAFGVAVIATVSVLPDGVRSRLDEAIRDASPTRLMLSIAAVLVLVNVLLYLAAIARFQRSKLVLD